LLSDVDREVGTRYEATRPEGEENAAYARRIAYLIDPEGVIQKSYEVTDVDGFAALVLEDVSGLKAG